MPVNWQGDKLLKKLGKAQKVGLNQTMADAVEFAKRNHEFVNRTGTLEGSIDIQEAAHRVAGGWKGTWGSRDVRYALRIELGFRGRDARGRNINQRERPFLRPAAEEKYPGLAGNIAKAMKQL